MAMNAQAWEEAAEFVRNGRIGMPFLLQALLEVGDERPRAGSQVRIRWEVRGRRGAERAVAIRADGMPLGEGNRGEILLRIADAPLDITLEVDGRETRRAAIRPLVRIPELLGLLVPPRLFHDEECTLQWAGQREVAHCEIHLDPETPAHRVVAVPRHANRIRLGRLAIGGHCIDIRLLSPDAAVSRRAEQLLRHAVEVRERPPRIDAGLDVPVVTLGQTAVLRWQVAGAVEVLLESPAGETRRVALAGALQITGESCGGQEWRLLARAPGGTESAVLLRLSVVAPPVILEVAPAAHPGRAFRFGYVCRNATRLELHLPDRGGQAVDLPMRGFIETDALVEERYRFVAEAADGAQVVHLVRMAPPPLRLESLPEGMAAPEPALSSCRQTLFSL